MKNIINNKVKISVFRSNRFLSAAFVDETGKTLFSMTTKKVEEKGKPVEKAKALGITLAETAKVKKVESVVFDRNGYRYHGQVKALADGLREGGLNF